MEDYVKKDGHIETYRDKGKGKTKGFGTIKCKSVQFSSVSYLKGLKHNVISITQLCDGNYEVNFSKKEGRMIDSNNDVVLSADCHNDIFILDIFYVDNFHMRFFFSHLQCHVNWSWHIRLSHLKFKSTSKILND